MTKAKFKIEYNGGTIYRRNDGGGYKAVLHAGGKQHNKTNKQIPFLKTWIDRNSGIVREGKVPLTNTENVEYRQAVALLPDGVTLMDAVRGFKDGLAQNEALRQGKKFGEGVDIFLSDCKTKRVKEPTYKNYEKYLKRVGKAWGNLSLPIVTTEMVRELLAQDDAKADTTRNQNHKLLTIYFNFAVKQKWISSNPISPVARTKIIPKRPEIFTVKEVAAVMETALRIAPEAVPYFALCFFAGIRPETVERLSWKHAENGMVFVPMELSKTPHDYEVPIRPNLKAWLDLTPLEHRKGELYPVSTNTLRGGTFKKIRKALGRKWIAHGARHMFASCVCALEGEAVAVSQMGHQSPSMLYRHYRSLIDKEQAKAFFEIFPSRGPSESATSSTSEGSIPNLAKTLPEIA